MAGRYTFLALVGLFFGLMFLLSNFERWQAQSLEGLGGLGLDGGLSTASLAAMILSAVPQLAHFLPSAPPSSAPPSLSNAKGKTTKLEGYKTRIVAVGDLHGDSLSAQKVLHFSGVVDDAGDWTGDVDMLVQTGDIIDRGDDTIKLYAWMDQLREQAKAKGGSVVSHLGNHEYMNALGDWRYVYPSELASQFNDSIALRQESLSHEGPVGQSWAKKENYHVASRVPLHPSLGGVNTPYPPPSSSSYEHELDFEDSHQQQPAQASSSGGAVAVPDVGHHAALSFVHGGLSPTYGDLLPYPSRINDLGHDLLLKGQKRLLRGGKEGMPHPPGPYNGLPADTTQAEAVLYDANGPLWYRGWAMNTDEAQVCKDAEKTLERIGARRMIMGHTPDFHNIVSRCNGKIIVIDTGISRAYGGRLSALRIDYSLTPNESEGWVEEEKVVALYEDFEQEITVDTRTISLRA